VSGAAALLCAVNGNLSVQQLKSLLIFNGDEIPALGSGRTLTGRRLNVFNSVQALLSNDTTAPGTVTNFRVVTQTARNIRLGWTDSGDDGAVGRASLYDVSFTDSKTGATVPLKKLVPGTSGTDETLDIKIPYRHTKGTISLRELDNVGNEGVPASLNVSVSFSDGDPYATTLGFTGSLTTGGTAIAGMNQDDAYPAAPVTLPFSFPFFG